MHEHGGNLTPYLKKNQPEFWIDFSANINCLGMPETVKQAAVQGVLDSVHYPDPGCNRLVESISQSLSVNKKWILCGNGAAELVYDALRVLKPGRALVAAPGFFEYEQALRSVNCEIVYASLQEKEGFLVTSSFLETLQKTPGVELVILTNPNNPTGRLIPPETLKRILEVCQKKGIWFLLDECFLDFTEDYPENSQVCQLEHYPRLLVLRAFTKMYAMPGLRMGYLLCREENFCRKIADSRQPWSVSVPAQEAALAALEEEEFVRQTREFLKKERPFLQSQLQELGFRVYGGEANFLFFFSEISSLREQLLPYRILIRDCGNFTGLDKGYYRIAVRIHEENLRLLEALRELLKRERRNTAWQ